MFGPATARLIDRARVAGRRRSVAECFEAAKQEVGLADYEVRSWHGWHRHITLAMPAPAVLAALRAGLNAAKGGAGPPPVAAAGPLLVPLSVPEVRRLIARLALGRAPPTPAFTLDRSFWRRAHQAIAQAYPWGRRIMTE